MAVNCGAITETLLEGELFGYVQGRVQGAERSQIGFSKRLRRTLLLDEIGELRGAAGHVAAPTPGALRAPVVGTREIPWISAWCPHQPHLEEEVRAARFREDLYYRSTL
jgi:transcriptional regulator with PAS, ATPase and Fis domain